MGLIAISVLFLFYALSFTQTLKGDHCMHFNNVMLLWGQPKRHIHGEVVQRPTLKGTMQIVPHKSHFRYSQQISASSRSLYMFAKHKNNLWHRVWVVIVHVLSNTTFHLCRKAPSQDFRKPVTPLLKMNPVWLRFPRMRLSMVLLFMLGLAHTKGDGPK